MTTAPIETDIAAGGPFRSLAASHPGAVRLYSEDRFVNRPDLGLWSVADGAGGHQAGDIVSQIVADPLGASRPDLAPPSCWPKCAYGLPMRIG
jgi:serine/threonine protein phosphatase PrpC